MRALHRLRLAALPQRIGGERPDRFQQLIARTGVHHLHEAVVDQRAQVVGRAPSIGRGVAHYFHLRECPAVGEYRQVAQQLLFGRAQQRIAPGDGGAQRALARRDIAIVGGRQIDRVVQLLPQRGWLEQAKSRRGQLERQRYPVESSANRCDVGPVGGCECEGGLRLHRTLHEELDGGGRQQRVHADCVHIGNGQRRYRELVLNADRERCPTGRDHAHAGTTRHQLGDVGGRVARVLHVVEQQESAASADHRRDRVQRRTPVGFGDAERGADRGHHVTHLGYRGE